MAIGTAAAILGGAALSAGASALSAKSASKAASKAAEQNAAIQQAQYNQTRSDLQPYTQMGYSAGNALSERFGLSQPQAQVNGAGYLAANPDVAAAWADPAWQAKYGGDVNAFAQAHYNASGQAEGRTLETLPANDTGMGALPGEDMSWASMERPSFGSAPGFVMDNTPSKQYLDELAKSTQSINARAGATRGYYSGGRALALQDNANRLWNADEQRRFNNALAMYKTSLDQYNQDRAVGNATFDTDRGFGAGRYDTNTGNLFNLLGVGANATQALAGYGQQNANNLAANNNALASAKGNAAIATGNAVGNAFGQAAGLYGLYGGKSPNALSSYSSIPTYNPTGLRIA